LTDLKAVLSSSDYVNIAPRSCAFVRPRKVITASGFLQSGLTNLTKSTIESCSQCMAQINVAGERPSVVAASGASLRDERDRCNVLTTYHSFTPDDLATNYSALVRVDLRLVIYQNWCSRFRYAAAFSHGEYDIINL
jgi:hypothetical protein